jgi:hypothetical protein
MTKAEALEVLDELAELVSAVPLKNQAKIDRAGVLIESLRTIPGLGLLARTLLVDVGAKLTLPDQRSELNRDIKTIRDRLEADLTEEADHGPPRP